MKNQQKGEGKTKGEEAEPAKGRIESGGMQPVKQTVSTLRIPGKEDR